MAVTAGRLLDGMSDTLTSHVLKLVSKIDFGYKCDIAQSWTIVHTLIDAILFLYAPRNDKFPRRKRIQKVCTKILDLYSRLLKHIHTVSTTGDNSGHGINTYARSVQRYVKAKAEQIKAWITMTGKGTRMDTFLFFSSDVSRVMYGSRCKASHTHATKRRYGFLSSRSDRVL